MIGRLVRAAWRIWLRFRFLLFQRHRHDRLVLEEVAGRSLLVLPQVFNPALFGTSEFLARTLAPPRIPPGAAVLDMGTGSGIGAVFAAPLARRVVAVDINPTAVRCARINALLHGVEDRVQVLHGDLFAPLNGERFDAVLFNPPYYRGPARDALDRAFRAEDVAERFADGLRAHLKPGGHALLVLSSEGEPGSYLDALAARGFRVEVAAVRRGLSESWTIYDATIP